MKTTIGLAIVAAMAALGTQSAVAQTAIPSEPANAVNLVDGLEGVFGTHAARRSGARGVCAAGEFVGNKAGAAISKASAFSGKPVPRYASLRHDVVNGRSGPSTDYPVKWTYERAGLPVVIIRESQDWRKIRDPMGDEVWVNKSQLAAERTVITVDAGVIVREPKPRAAPVARFEAGAVVTLGTCGEEWCRVAAEGREGWVRRSLVWGADPLTAPPENR